MPTYESSPQFQRDHSALTPEQRRLFRRGVEKFVADLQAGQGFRKGLRVKGIQAWPGMFEMTWADDGRAVFSYGPPRRPREPHVIWHVVGTHEVLP